MAYPLAKCSSVLQYVQKNITTETTLDNVGLVIHTLKHCDWHFDLHTLSSYSYVGPPQGYSIMHLLARSGNSSLISQLIRKYGNHLLEIEDKSTGQRLLHCAVEWHRVEVVGTLLELRAEVNVKSSCWMEKNAPQCTVLCCAAEKTQNIPIVKLLLGRGAKAEPALSEAGEQILQVAESDLRNPFIQVLRKERAIVCLPHAIIDLIVNYIPVEELPDIPPQQINEKVVLNFFWKGPSSKRGAEDLNVSRIQLVCSALKTRILVRIPSDLGPEDVSALPFSCRKTAPKEVQAGKGKPVLSESSPMKLLFSIDDVRNLTLKAGIFKGNTLDSRQEVGLRLPEKIEKGQTYSLVVTSDNLALSAALIKRQPAKKSVVTAKADPMDRQRMHPISSYRIVAFDLRQITIEDGSGWKIALEDYHLTSEWRIDDLLSITSSRSAQDFCIINRTRRSSVKASLVEGPLLLGGDSHWVSDIGKDKGIVVLENQTRWCVDPQDLDILTSEDWGNNDYIIGVLNSDEDSPYNHLLFNVNMLSKVRVKEAE